MLRKKALILHDTILKVRLRHRLVRPSPKLVYRSDEFRELISEATSVFSDETTLAKARTCVLKEIKLFCISLCSLRI